jgi:molybdenum cofactor synthesis domain-containing protein
VELIAVGRELLRGRVVDDNSQTLARFLTQRGIQLRRIVVVDDSEDSISSALREALSRNPNLVITTGGLGPALDDRTVGAVADGLGLPLVMHAGARTLVETAYRNLRGRKQPIGSGMTATREKMCRLPVGSRPIPNPVGIAPGMVHRLPGGATVLCLPGTPREMVAVLEQAMPWIKELAPTAFVARREMEAPTADESALQPLLDRLAQENPDVWITSHPPQRRGGKIRIVLEASGRSEQRAALTVDRALKRLLALAAGSP